MQKVARKKKKVQSKNTPLKVPFRQQMAASAYHLKQAEIKKLIIAATNFRDRCIIKTLYWLGLRRQELAKLDVLDIDFQRKRVTVREGKGGKTRTIPIIDDEYLSDLKHLIGTRKDGPVFLSNQNKELSMRAINYIVELVGERAEIENPHPGRQHLNPHLFRHSIARDLKRLENLSIFSNYNYLSGLW